MPRQSVARRPMFGEAAAATGQLTVEQLEECLGLQELRRRDGAEVKIGEVLIERGYLTQVQVHLLLNVQRGVKTRLDVGGFEIIAKLGRGGMSTVYKARDLTAGRLVALKIMPPKAAENRAMLERFRREARAAMLLDHPNIVKGLTSGEDQGFHYYAMEYVRGRSLMRLIHKEGRLPEHRAIYITRQVADALNYSEALGILHRDIKPDNLLVHEDDFVKVTDFGLSRFVTGDDTMLTLPGTAVGTPYYMSPEQARGDSDIDTRSDLYSLGATFYEMLTGDPPHPGPSVALILAQHLTAIPPDPRTVSPDLSDAVCRLVASLLAKERGERPASPAVLMFELDALLNERSDS